MRRGGGEGKLGTKEGGREGRGGSGGLSWGQVSCVCGGGGCSVIIRGSPRGLFVSLSRVGFVFA